MRGKYGVSMGGIEHKPKKHYCKQCEYWKDTCSKKRKKPKQPTLCKHFKRKWKDAKTGEITTYYVDPTTL